ncbi:hypothetical protein H1R20_g14743, partial [Candolleomyces eurysporus]
MGKLSGAVPDADAMSNYLRRDLKVPPDQITNLRNKEATRSNIIAAFEGLRDNSRIKHQDPILIYYAGHGGEVPSNSKDKTQTLIPVDYVAERIHPIPDRTVAALINGISTRHGNNITVILDCCHSGSGTRGEEETNKITVRGCELSPNDVPDDLDEHIRKENLEPNATAEYGTRGLSSAKGFAMKDMNSHILLAACSANELAREDNRAKEAHGRFTTALLELLRSVPLDQITYANFLSRMPRIDGQNPQCEGYHRNRILFDSKVRPPTSRHNIYEVKLENKKYTLEGGRAHGITDGAEFTLYRNREVALVEEPLGVMIAREDKINPFTTILEPVGETPGAFENSAIAIQTKAGASEDLLVYVPLESQYMPFFEEIAREMSGAGPDSCRIKLVDKAEKDKAKLEIVGPRKNQLTFKVLEKQAMEHGFTRMPHLVDAEADDFHHILRAASHYHFHLNLNHQNNKIKNSIKIEFFPLKEDYNDDGEVYYSPGGENMHRGGRIEYEVDEDTKYGMKMINNTPWDLHFYVFYFEHADFSITALTEVDAQTCYDKDYSLKRDATVEIGYGNSSIPPFECGVPEGLDLTIGFLKVYFVNEVVDLSHVPQITPFSEMRTGGVTASASRGRVRAQFHRRLAVWGTILIPVIQKRKQKYRA